MITRRSFLGLAGGLAVLAACGGDDDTSSRGDSPTIDHDHDELTDLAPAVLSSDLYAGGTTQRFAFALVAKEGYASGDPVRVAVAPGGTEPTAFVDTTLHTDGLPTRRGVYVAELAFDTAGTWDGLVDRDGELLPFAFTVKEQHAAPAIGDAAPTAPSPTPPATLEVDPICTRDPMCELHGVSLDAVIGQGRPVLVLFATPARCTSQYCGPVLDTLLPLVPEYEDRVTIVHVEIYKDLESEDLVPTVLDWALPAEPFLFGVAGDGTVTARLDGAFGQDEVRAVLDDLAARA